MWAETKAGADSIETKLINDYREGDQKSLDALFRVNENLVYFVYNKFFKNCGCPKEDLIQEGNIGLFEAIKRFKPDYSDRFIGYKILWIKKRMFDFRRNFFKLNIVELNETHNSIEWETPRSEKLRRDIFDLDLLVKSGRIKKSRADRLLNKIEKGKYGK